MPLKILQSVSKKSPGVGRVNCAQDITVEVKTKRWHQRKRNRGLIRLNAIKGNLVELYMAEMRCSSLQVLSHWHWIHNTTFEGSNLQRNQSRSLRSEVTVLI